MLRYKEIKNLLAAEIAKLSSNDRLPSRPELCKKLDTTRTTLDRAINELVTEGLLFSRRGDGTYVVGADEEISIHKGNWGVIVPNVMEMVYTGIVRGVEDVAQSYGISIILCNSDSNFEKQEQYIKRLNHSGVSGFILVPIFSRDKDENNRLYSQLINSKVPFVFCNRNTEGINAPVVTSNNFYGSYIATKHLLGKGYRNIAYISNEKSRVNLDRFQGYITALLKNGIEINRKIISIVIGEQVQLSGYEAMKKVLASGQLVDAVFCFYDKVAQGAYQAIAEAGLRVSDDIGVIGYDNSEICEKLTPAVTSVAYKSLEIGTQAAKMLYKQISGETLSDLEFYLFNPDLVVRDSCLGPKTKVTTNDEMNESEM
jgi:DNA-binding LacI/PurR family transcriptional regulator/biotin operon repressor